MTVYSYLIEHDLGLAPNPFGKYCTLAVCKPLIRKSSNLKIGDWVIGTGSKALGKAIGQKLENKLIYAMELTEKISLEDYWNDTRFQYKKPVMNGTLVTMHGDNFYHKDLSGKWIQEDSAHSNPDGSCNLKHLKKDVSGTNVLISEHFFYFGNNAPKVPSNLKKVFHTGVGQKKVEESTGKEFLNWIKTNFKTGINGDPLSWDKHKQYRLDFSDSNQV